MLPRIAYISEVTEDERRGKTRRTVYLPAASDASAWGPRAVLLDLSETGLRLQCHAPPEVGEAITVDLPMVGQVEARVAWQSNGQCGAEFAQPVTKAVVSAAILSSPPRERMVASGSEKSGSPVDLFPLRTEWALLALLPIVLLLLFALAYLPVSGF